MGDADANNNATKFTYDPDGDLLSLTDANNHKTSYVYDSRDRMTKRTDALSRSESYVYDANSNLTQHTDRNSAVTVYTYDALNRRTFGGFGHSGSSYTAGTIKYTWDGGDRLTQAVDSIAGTISRVYDGLNRLSSETTPQGTVGYTYDNGGRRLTMTVPGQSTANYTWDNANRLTGITQGSSAVGFNYDNANRRTCLALPNGVLVSYGYDTDSRVNSIGYGTGGSCGSPPTNLGTLTYSGACPERSRRDADGRRITMGGSLAAVTLPAAVGSSTIAYNADNEQTKFGSATGISYDNNGDLKSGGGKTYTWDARHHLTAISGGASASFVGACPERSRRNGFGRRMKKTVSGAVTQFLYDRLNPVQELNSSGGVTANLLTGLRIDEYFTRTDSGGAMSFLTDALGSTIGLVGSGGAINTSYTYQPFGAETTGGAANTNPYQFTGRESDGTGLYYYRARYYSPTYQRFVAQDPIGFAGGVNLYAYALNNPVSFRDPFGRCSEESLALFPTPDPNCMLQNLGTGTGAAIPPLCVGAGAVCVASGFAPACILAITTCSYGIGVEAYCSSQSVGVEPPPLPPEPPVPPPPE